MDGQNDQSQSMVRNHDNQHTMSISMDTTLLRHPNVLLTMSNPQTMNNFLPPVAMDNNHSNVSPMNGLDVCNHSNLPPLDGMKMENIVLPTMPNMTLATNHVTTATAQMSVPDQKASVKQSGMINKDIPVEDLEFDGNTVLCRVCGDKASGFHYGVHACEGCKGFFRRSIQQKIQYRPCLKNQMCNIMRVNRNRCQYCRLRKCIAVGMSRDAVRFGRVPKREKAKILEQMQKVNAQLQGTLLNDALCEPTDVVEHVVAAHAQFCDFTHAKFATLFEKAWESPSFVDCPAHMACPLSPAAEQADGLQKWDEFSSCFTPAIRNVVNFAKSIPGFSVFSQEDQVTLLKAGTFEVMLVHLACLFDTRTNTMMFTNGCLYRKVPQQGNSSAGFLLDSMFDFADRLNQLRLTDNEVALFTAMVVTAPDRPGLRYHEQVQRVHSVLSHGLQTLMKANHPEEPAAFSKLLMKIPDLRTLNTLHSEKLLGLTVPQNCSDPKTPNDEQVLPPSVPSTIPELQPKSELTCPIERSKSPVVLYTEVSTLPNHVPVPPYPLPMMRCPMNSGSLPPIYSSSHIVPHQVQLEPNDQELILKTPFGSFHRHTLPYGPPDPKIARLGLEAPPHPNNGIPRPGTPTDTHMEKTTENLKMTADASSSPPHDFIDVDMPPKSTNQMQDLRHMLGKESIMGKMDVRRMMIDPVMSDMYRKRVLENTECEIDPKLAKLWEYDMRSSRSNSLSSSSSQESTDSAYKTISNPGTPRSHYDMVRSPYSSPAAVCTRLTPHTLTTPSVLTKVAEECPETQRAFSADHKPDGTPLPTLRRMLLAQSEKKDEKEEDGDDQHYFLHKKLKLKSCLIDRNKNDGVFRTRAASFSTAMGKMRPRMAPPFIRPLSVEAPPRLTTKSPQKFVEDVTPVEKPDETSKCPMNSSTAPFAMIASRVVEAALTERREEERKYQESSEPIREPEPTSYPQTDRILVEDLQTASPHMSSVPTSHSTKPTSRMMPSKPSERHPELLSRLTSGVKVNGAMCRSRSPPSRGWERGDRGSRTPPPQLYPIPDALHGTYTEPPSLRPVVSPDHHAASHIHVSAISSLKDKLLSRIDSMDNLNRLSPQQVRPDWSESREARPESSRVVSPDASSRKRPHPCYLEGKSSTPALNTNQQQNQFLPPNGSLPIQFPPGFYGNGRGIPAGIHPMMYNPAAQFQALQHLHAQAAHIQQQMVHISNISNMAAINAMKPRPVETTNIDAIPRHHRPSPHSHPITPFSQSSEPINLTTDPSNLRPFSGVKSEPV